MSRILSRVTRIWQHRTTLRTGGTGYFKPPTVGVMNRFPPAIRVNPYWRTFGGLSTVLVPPVVFGGLVVTLWTWKCLMMILFQNKIIYMPGLPLNARKEKIQDYKNQCGGIQWQEMSAISGDRTRISLCAASVDCCPDASSRAQTVYVLYFQGNTSSLPPRLPLLSSVLRLLKARSIYPVRYTMVCCSYRGYWSSEGRPSEKGLAIDAITALEWSKEYHDCEADRSLEERPIIVIWGQSIGASVATNLAARTYKFSELKVSLNALILETPFVSARAMLETLYPQKWLPYRYLWPFLWNQLDSWSALGLIQKSFENSGLKSPVIFMLQAGRDELVPKEHTDALQRRCLELGLDVQKKIIGGALHTNVMTHFEGKMAIVEAVEAAVRK